MRSRRPRRKARSSSETVDRHAAGGSPAAWRRIKRLVQVDQKPIGRTPRSNLATYTGLFDDVRKLFAATKQARARHYDAGRFSFNVAKGRCETCEGEGFVMVELLFLPSVYAPCPTCHGARYNAKTLEIKYRDKTIAEVLGMTVDAAWEFFAEEPQRPSRPRRSCARWASAICAWASRRPSFPAARPSASSSRPSCSAPQRGDTLYVLDEPTTGLHPADVERLMAQLDGLVDAGNTVIVVEHDMRVVAGSDWVIDIGPGAGDEGGQRRRHRHPGRGRQGQRQPHRALSRAIHADSRVTFFPSVIPAKAGIHMWTAPCLQGCFGGLIGIACAHMSGLLMRSHMSAAKMGSARWVPNRGAMLLHHWIPRNVPPLGSIDHATSFLQASTRTRRLAGAALNSLRRFVQGPDLGAAGVIIFAADQ